LGFFVRAGVASVCRFNFVVFVEHVRLLRRSSWSLERVASLAEDCGRLHRLLRSANRPIVLTVDRLLLRLRALVLHHSIAKRRTLVHYLFLEESIYELLGRHLSVRWRYHFFSRNIVTYPVV